MSYTIKKDDRWNRARSTESLYSKVSCLLEEKRRKRISSFRRRRSHFSNMENMGLSATGENSHGFLPIVSLTSVETK